MPTYQGLSFPVLGTEPDFFWTSQPTADMIALVGRQVREQDWRREGKENLVMATTISLPDLTSIHWLGHDSFLIVDGPGKKRVVIDPFKLRRHEPVDLILISHAHHDHYSAEDIAKLRQPETIFVVAPTVAKELIDVPADKLVILAPGEKATVAGIKIEAVAAYNTNKFRAPGVPFHPKEDRNVGFIVSVGGSGADGLRVYHAGDTDAIPEMAGAHGQGLGVDVALVPVSGTYVMLPEEAVEAVAAIRPRVSIPMHYGSLVGSEAEARRFADLCAARGFPVRILRQEDI